MLERHYEVPGGSLPYFHTSRLDESKVIDMETNNYAVILQSTIFTFEANVSMIFMNFASRGSFHLEVSYQPCHADNKKVFRLLGCVSCMWFWVGLLSFNRWM